MWVDKCPKCKCGDLYVTSFVAESTWIPLCPDGFAAVDAHHMDTTDEMVRCGNQDCGAVFKLSELDAGEKEYTGEEGP